MNRYRRTIRATLMTVLPALCVALLLCAAVLSACSKSEVVQNEYTTSHQCHYMLNFEVEGITTSCLFKALTSANTFAIFSTLHGSPGYRLDARLDEAGQRDTVAVRMEENIRPTRILGIGNSLIAGHSSFEEGALYVYDGVCPNCYSFGARVKYLRFSAENGTNVTCPSCKRTYGLMNGGVIVSGASGAKLVRYHASFGVNAYQNHILSISSR